MSANRDSAITVLYEVMSKGGWWTLPELERVLEARRGRRALQTSVSARLRDLRKPPWNRSVCSRKRAGTTRLEEYTICSASEKTNNGR